MSQMIYIADDEKNIRNLIAAFLRKEGYEVEEFEKKNEEKMTATLRIQGSQAETYLIQIYQVPGNTPWIRRLATYSPVDYINRWIGRTTWIVLVISLALAASVIAVLKIAVQRVEKGTLWLCKEAKRMGDGDFEPVAEAFSVKELENLRKTMNQMAVKLREAQEARTRFLQDISHDLRTPLMSIGGYAQGIEQGADGYSFRGFDHIGRE